MGSQKISTSIVWPPCLTVAPTPLPDFLKALKKSERWPTKKLAQGQRMQLRRLLDWAAQKVPYYRDSD